MVQQVPYTASAQELFNPTGNLIAENQNKWVCAGVKDEPWTPGALNEEA